MMDIKGLQYFITAAERLNFTVAAKECYITQTAMSLHIKKMEDELGFRLFNRNKHATELTRAGADFYTRARALVFEYDAAVRHAASIESGVVGVVGILVPGCIEGFILMDKLRTFRTRYPDVEVNMYVDSLGRHIGRLKMGNADICVGPPDEMELEEGLVVHKLREDPIVVVCGANHRLAKEKCVTPEMLKDDPVVFCGHLDSPGTFRVLRGSKLFPGFDVKSIIMADNMDELLFLIEMERGISFMPAFASQRIASDTAGVVFLPIDYGDMYPDAGIPMTTTAVGYLQKNTNPVIKPLLDIILSK